MAANAPKKAPKKAPSRKPKKRTSRDRAAEKTSDLSTEDPEESTPTRQRRQATEKKNAKRVAPEIALVFDKFVKRAEALGVAGVVQEYQTAVKTVTAGDRKMAAFTANTPKNRFMDIPCVDETRVVLDATPDYIHANWVKLDGLDRNYIACQAPLENTIEDFWQMVHQEQPVAIVVLINKEEMGTKCADYWPRSAGTYRNYGKMFVDNKKSEEVDKFTLSTIEVLPEGCSNSALVKLLHFTHWPDHGIPTSAHMVLRLLQTLRPLQPTTAPILLHCSAGIGRTGAVIAIDAAIQRLLKGRDVDVKELVLEIRRHRALAVQADIQYLFIFMAILSYIKAKQPGVHDAVVRKFIDDLKAHLAANPPPPPNTPPAPVSSMTAHGLASAPIAPS